MEAVLAFLVLEVISADASCKAILNEIRVGYVECSRILCAEFLTATLLCFIRFSTSLSVRKTNDYRYRQNNETCNKASQG